VIARILIALEKQKTRQQLKKLLSRPDVIVEFPSSRANLWERIGRETCDLVVAGRSLIPEPTADSLEKYKSLMDAPALVVLIDRDDPEEHARLTSEGCDAVLSAGLPPAELAESLAAILERQLELSRKTISLKRVVQQPRLKDFVSNSVIMKEFMDLVGRVVDSKSSLLILGETGVGKERLARAIHSESGRPGAFVAVNCGALPESLLESELFGHEEGAFTGATRARRGCFELAHRGTIFLDEIGEMPHHLQVRLLRVLQDHEVQRVGGEWPIQVDTRVMAATARDLDDMVEEGGFRNDLLYRLSVVTLKVPPLRERKEDIPDLTQSYIAHFAAETGREVTGIGEEALQALIRYDWPGNVRELINVIERAILLCGGISIELQDLPHTVRLAVDPASLPAVIDAQEIKDAVFPQSWFEQPLREAREHLVVQFEKAYLSSLLKDSSGRIDETARRAGITTRALFDKMQRYGLKKEDFKSRGK
jgi:two-component system response regulator AtoC